MSILQHTIKIADDMNPFIQLFVQWFSYDVVNNTQPEDDENIYIQSSVEVIQRSDTEYLLKFASISPDKLHYAKSIILKESKDHYLYFVVPNGVSDEPLQTNNNILELFTVPDTFEMSAGNYIIFKDFGIYAIIDVGKLPAIAGKGAYNIWDFNIVYPPKVKALYTTLIGVNKDKEHIELAIDEQLNIRSNDEFSVFWENGLNIQENQIIPTVQTSAERIVYINGIYPSSGNLRVSFNTVMPTNGPIQSPEDNIVVDTSTVFDQHFYVGNNND